MASTSNTQSSQLSVPLLVTPQTPLEMQTPTPPPTLTPNSKRKRLSSDSGRDVSPSPYRLKTSNLPSRPLGLEFDLDILSEGSPQATVAGHLQSLDIREQDTRGTGLDFGMSPRTSKFSSEFAPQIILPSDQTPRESALRTPPSSSHCVRNSPSLFTEADSPLQTLGDSALPEAPSDAPSLTATTNTNSLSPPTPDPRLGNKSPVHTTNSSNDSSQPSSLLSLWWTDTEITGYRPSDPTDDGYGINGIGFVPTPAMAKARAEKRRRQVREWKAREARDARARRGQRRQRSRMEAREGARDKARNQEEGERVEVVRKVRFSDDMDTDS